jgi:DNA-binding NarL/FixJ family response regulator
VAADAQRPKAVLRGLTRRELDILDHVVAGRTYGEIARALVISEKTVSSHISNLLRKTGAANRRDLARLASADASDSPVSRGSA